MDQPQAPAPDAAQAGAAPQEDQIIDQIGQLLGQLSPEKQQMVVAKLGEMLAGQEAAEPNEAAPMPQGTSSSEGGPNGQPYQGV